MIKTIGFIFVFLFIVTGDTLDNQCCKNKQDELSLRLKLLEFKKDSLSTTRYFLNQSTQIALYIRIINRILKNVESLNSSQFKKVSKTDSAFLYLELAENYSQKGFQEGLIYNAFLMNKDTLDIGNEIIDAKCKSINQSSYYLDKAVKLHPDFSVSPNIRISRMKEYLEKSKCYKQ